MQFNRVGNSGLVVSDLTLGTFEWGSRVDAATAQALVETYAGAGGTVLELASLHGPAIDIVGSLKIPDTVRILTRIGVRAGQTPGVSNDRLTLWEQIESLRSHLQRDVLDIVLLDAFDDQTPLAETADALGVSHDKGHVGYVGAAHHEGWQLACTRASGLKLTLSANELSLLEREAEFTVLPAAEYMEMGVFAGAVLGRGVLTGQYQHGTPKESRAASWAAGWVSAYLDEPYQRVVAGVTKAASGLGVQALDVALAWNRSLPVASNMVAPRTLAQLEDILASDTVLEPEIIDALGDVSAQ